MGDGHLRPELLQAEADVSRTLMGYRKPEQNSPLNKTIIYSYNPTILLAIHEKSMYSFDYMIIFE